VKPRRKYTDTNVSENPAFFRLCSATIEIGAEYVSYPIYQTERRHIPLDREPTILQTLRF